MRLKELLNYNRIVVQCHNNPDADALASGYAVYLYLKNAGKEVQFVYGGQNRITKSNLKLMIKELHIPIEYVTDIEKPELLVTVDCQYEEGNVKTFPADQVAIIDHHRVSPGHVLPKLSEVRSNLGSCSTLVWLMLRDEKFIVNKDTNLATALYYGLYTDTNAFTEISHPMDKDLRDQAQIDDQKIALFRNANISIEELEVAGTALLRSDYMEQYRCSIVKAGQCDPNVLGLISDLILEVDAVDTCLVFNVLPDGVKFSVRSCVKTVQANELAEELAKGIGSGGGHISKAGGFIPLSLLIPEYQKYCEENQVTPRMVMLPDGEHERPSDSAIKSVLEGRLVQYFENSEIIRAGEDFDLSGMEIFYRKPIPYGFVYAADLFAPGTKVTLRAVSGDINTRVEENMVILINIEGVAILTTKETFENCYSSYPDPFYLVDPEYDPTIRAKDGGETYLLTKHTRICIPKENMEVRVKELKHNVKLFTEWDDSKYLKGRVGNYLVILDAHAHDIFMVEKEYFHRAYSRTEVAKENSKKAVIFDLDGTLLDTLEDLTNAVNYALESVGAPTRSIEEVRKFVGNGVEKLMIRALPDGKENPQFDQAFANFKEYYGAHSLDHTKPYADILVVLKELKQRGIKTAIVSNKIDFAVKDLDKAFFEGLTGAAIGETEKIARKPAPDMVRKALTELGVAPEDAVYVGDSDVDIETAKNAGLDCISVTWGFRDSEFLMEHGAQLLIERPLQLLSHI